MWLKVTVFLVILGILVGVGVYFYNPSERLREARDRERINDLQTIKAALDFYISKNADTGALLCNNCTLGTTVFSYLPLSFSGATNVTRTAQWVNGNGWLPVDLSLNMKFGETPLKVLPIDPVNKFDLVYTYTPGVNGKYKLTAKMESQMGLGKAKNDGGDLPDRYEIGDLSLKP